MGLQLTLAPNGVKGPSDVTPHMFSCQRSSGRARCANGKNIPSHSRTVHGASHFEASLLLFLLFLVEQLFPRYRRFLKIPVASANFGVGEGQPAVQFAQDGPPLLAYASRHWPPVKFPRSQGETAVHALLKAVLHPAPNPRPQRGVGKGGIKNTQKLAVSSCFSQWSEGVQVSVQRSQVEVATIHVNVSMRIPSCTSVHYCLLRVH